VLDESEEDKTVLPVGPPSKHNILTQSLTHGGQERTRSTTQEKKEGSGRC
jgi:hypothetical protein